MDLKNWTIFSLLEPEFITNIKMACVFGNLGNEAFIVTKDDEVLALGSNASGCLGLGHLNSTLMPVRVDALCGKRVAGFAYGSGPHVLAYTEDGELYTWGHNGYCELGYGSSYQQHWTPSLVQSILTGKVVVEVACGSHHSLVLTEDGEVYAWGQNNCGQVGSGTSANQSLPRKVNSVLNAQRCVTIACGQTFSMAVTDTGEVYGWGYNGNGQLGLGNNVNQANPCRVSALAGVVVKRVACGYAHTLAMTDVGALYTWGANSFGQLGSGCKTNVNAPVRVCVASEPSAQPAPAPDDAPAADAAPAPAAHAHAHAHAARVVDVAASHLAHLSAAITQSSRVYMWGHCRGQSITTPFATPFSSLHDVFACFASPSVMRQPLQVEQQIWQSVADSLRQAFDDQSTSDLTILVEDRPIYVHKVVLKIRCQHFRSMFQKHWQEDNESEIRIDQFSHNVYRAFLQFLYTDEVNLSPENALELLVLASAYCETYLKHRCEQIIRQGITVENTAMLYATAIQYQAKELEEFCFKFFLNHMTAIIQSEGFGSLDEQTLKDFIRKAAKRGAFKS